MTKALRTRFLGYQSSTQTLLAFWESTQKCLRTLGRDCLTTRTSSRLSQSTLVGVCQPFSGCSRERVGGIEFDGGTVFPKYRLILTQFSVLPGDR